MLRVAATGCASVVALMLGVAHASAGGIAAVSPPGDVTPAGTFVQRVPVEVPSYHGLEPSVGLVYDSSNRDGLVGWGWRLLGDSSIERASRRTGTPRFNHLDDYLLDGERLVPCFEQATLGASCSFGGTHGLEHETFQRVRHEGAEWIVSDRDGVESHYAQPQSATLFNVRWALAYRTDPRGNRIDYHRWCDGDDECYLDDVEYHDASQAKLRTHIEYRWEKRPHQATYAVGRSTLVHVRYRLLSIIVWSNRRVRSALDITYQANQLGRWAGASSISAITRYGSDVTFDAKGRITGGSHLPVERYATVSSAPPADLTPKTVTFGASASPASNSWDLWTFPTTLADSAHPDQQRWTALDVNGDGLDDSVATIYNGPGHGEGVTDLVIHINRGDGTFRDPVTVQTQWLYWFPPPSRVELGQTLVAGDFNGDGLKDLLAIWATNTTPAVQAQVAFGSASVLNPASPPNALKLVTFGPLLSLPVAEWTADHRWLVGDQDGDGRDDLIIVEHMDVRGCTTGPRACTYPRIHVLRSDGRSFTELGQGQDVNWTDFPDEAPYWFMGDVDGDSRADIIRVESVFGANGRTARFGIARSTSAGAFAFSTLATRAPWEPIVFSGRFGWRPIGADLAKAGDFDGNGLTDIVIFAAWTANSKVNFAHLRTFTFLAQGSGLSNAFELKEQDLNVGILRQNNYSGAGNLVANTISFPNKWFATDVNRDGVADLVLVTAPAVSGGWPQQHTLVLTFVSNRDGTFREPEDRTVDVLFDCWGANNAADCENGPMFDVAPAELNGDQESDLLFAHLVDQSGFVKLTGLPASDTYDPALNLHTADVSGDGRLDLIQLRPLGDTVRVQTLVLQDLRFSFPSPVVREYSTQGVPLAGLDVGHWRIGDIGSPTGGTPDGRADLFYQSVDLTGQSSPRGMAKLRRLALLSNGDGTFTASGPAGGSYTNSASSLWHQGDFDGHGAASLTRVLAGPNNLTVDDAPFNTSADVAAAGFFAVDLDGDGLTDLVAVDAQMSSAGVESQTVVALLSVEGGNFHLREWPLPSGMTGIPARSWRPAEINGDGRMDMVSAIPDAAGNESVVGLLFTGDGWEPQTQRFDQTLGAPRTAVQISDFNGDGCADLAWQNSAPALNPRLTWLMNQCDGRLAWSTADPGAALDTWTRSWQPVDLDGNGQDELLAFRTTGTDQVTLLRYGTNESAGLLGGVDNGIGLSLSVAYGTTAGTSAPTRFGRTQFLVRSVRFGAMLNSSGLDSTYTYTGALWSGTRNFVGFGTVSVNAKPVGSTAFNHYLVTTYDQSEGCAMQPLRTEVRGATGLFWADTATYNDTSQLLANPTAPFATAPWICELERTGHTECELTSTCRETSVQVRHYDGFGNVTELVGSGDPSNPTDNRTVSTHMARPNIARYLVSLPFDIETKDASGNRIAYTQTYYDGATSSTTVPSTGNPSRTDEWDPVLGTLTTQRAYDAVGNIRQITDADGRKSSTKWDPVFARFPVRQCNVLWCISQQWDLVMGTKLVDTDANHRSIRSVYDALSRHRRTDFPDGGCLTHAYPNWGPQANPFDFAQQRVVETHCGPGSNEDVVVGPWHATYFDGLQRPWRETRSGGYERLRAFAGWKSNPEAETAWKSLGGQNVWTRYHYDDAQRLSNVELPDSQRVITTYDVGATTERSPTGGVHRTTLDGWDRVESVSDDVSVGGARVSATATYTYDALDRMLTAKDANGHVTSWSRSPAGWLRRECRPDTGCRTREFSRAGLLRSESDALGGRVRYDYDKIGRRRHRRQYGPAGALLETSTWTYDRSPARPGEPNLVGRITSISSTSKTSEELLYDVMGRVVRRRMCVSGDCVMVGFGWSSLGNLDALTYPDASGSISPSSEIVHYAYDDANRLQEIDPYVPHITYEPDDQPHSLQFQNGAVQTFLYDPKRRLVDEMKVVGPQGLISQWTYHYYADGNLKDELRRGLLNSQRVFKYDPSGRLLESRGGAWQTYAYDLAGNVVQQNATTYSYTDPAHPNAVTHAGGLVFTYDANGNPTSRNFAPLKWDSLGRMLRADSGPDQIDYIYSADGALARRRHAGSNTDYFGPYVEKLPNGTLAVNYLLGDTVIARREAATGVRFLHRDKLGSTTEVTDANGAAVELYEYDPWGKSRGALGITNDFRFGRGRQDADTRLVRLGVRDLDPEVGRFISPDPLVADPHRPIDLNPYVYARDDPLNTVDPTGQAPPDELQDIFKKIGEIVDAVEEQSKKIRGAKPSNPTTNPSTNGETTTPKDPADVALERPTDVKTGDPASSGRQPSSGAASSPLISQSPGPLYRSPFQEANLGAGVQGGGELTICIILCGSLQLSAGLYQAPATGEITPFFTIGGGILVGEGPPDNQSFDPPRINTPIPLLGLGAQFGGTFGGFVTESRTYSDFAGWSENLNIWVPGMNVSLGVSEVGQTTVYAGPSFDIGTPIGVSLIPSHTLP